MFSSCRRTAHLLLFLLFFATYNAFAQDEPEYELPEVVVTAGRIPTEYSTLSRTVDVITHNELQRSPGHMLENILASIPGVDIRRRGPGVQSDIALRGGSFEQTLILIDGVPVSDPQTGHNTMNVPLSYDEIERIEVLKGPGARAFGANAFAGVVNIITRNKTGNRYQLRGGIGAHGLYDASAVASARLGSGSHTLSYEQQHSDGYRENTDYTNRSVSYGFRLPFSASVVDIRAGYTDKQFGANGFYSQSYPLQWERLKTALVSAGLDVDHGDIDSRLTLSWRNGGDEFLLNRENPSFYRNVHSTNSYTGLYSASYAWAGGITVAGMEAHHDAINSTNLGIHERTTGGVFAEHRFDPVKDLSISFGGYAHTYGSYGWQVSPGADAAWVLGGGWRAFGSVGRSFRVPTFTELFYSDPANIGNADLQPERAWTYEAGLSWGGTSFRAQASVFFRDASDLIDWTRENDSDPWQVMNFTGIRTTGSEVSVEAGKLPGTWGTILSRIRAGYAYLSSDVDTRGESSKYVLEHLRHQVTLDIVHGLPFAIVPAWRVRYLQRIAGDSYIVTDLRLSREISGVDMFVSATNLFNQPYTEIGTIPMPGRWIQGGISFRGTFD